MESTLQANLPQPEAAQPCLSFYVQSSTAHRAPDLANTCNHKVMLRASPALHQILLKQET